MCLGELLATRASQVAVLWPHCKGCRRRIHAQEIRSQILATHVYKCLKEEMISCSLQLNDFLWVHPLRPIHQAMITHPQVHITIHSQLGGLHFFGDAARLRFLYWTWSRNLRQSVDGIDIERCYETCAWQKEDVTIGVAFQVLSHIPSQKTVILVTLTQNESIMLWGFFSDPWRQKFNNQISVQYSIYMMPYAYDVVLQHARVGMISEAQTMLPQPGRHFRPLAAGGVRLRKWSSKSMFCLFQVHIT